MEKSTIVFIHGDTQNHTIFNNIARFFQSIGQNVLLLDLPGHGNESPYSKNHLEFLKMKLSHLTNPIICAHSSGGIFALDYILHTKNASSLILINALLSNPKLMDNSFDWESSFGNFRSLSKTLFKKQCLTDYSKFDNIGDDEISKMGLETTDPISLGRNIDFYLNLSADFIALHYTIYFGIDAMKYWGWMFMCILKMISLFEKILWRKKSHKSRMRDFLR